MKNNIPIQHSPEGQRQPQQRNKQQFPRCRSCPAWHDAITPYLRSISTSDLLPSLRQTLSRIVAEKKNRRCRINGTASRRGFPRMDQCMRRRVDWLLDYLPTHIHQLPARVTSIDWLIDWLICWRYSNERPLTLTYKRKTQFYYSNYYRYKNMQNCLLKRGEKTKKFTTIRWGMCFYPNDDADQQKSVATKFPSGVNVI